LRGFQGLVGLHYIVAAERENIAHFILVAHGRELPVSAAEGVVPGEARMFFQERADFGCDEAGLFEAAAFDAFPQGFHAAKEGRGCRNDNTRTGRRCADA
jgi:hypothetical protein